MQKKKRHVSLKSDSSETYLCAPTALIPLGLRRFGRCLASISFNGARESEGDFHSIICSVCLRVAFGVRIPDVSRVLSFVVIVGRSSLRVQVGVRSLRLGFAM